MANQMRRVFALFLLSVSLVSARVEAQSTAAGKRVSILFIGNSYTFVNDLPGVLKSMAANSTEPVDLATDGILIGGASLKAHWEAKGTTERIRNGEWDYVVLQEQSLLPIENPDAMLDYGNRLGRVIRSAKAKPVVYLTWARKTRPSSQDSLNRAYLQLARQIDAIVVPVGPAWQSVQRLDPSLELYDADGSHPSPLGTYVAAATFHRVLFGRLPSTTTAQNLSPQTVALVHRAVEDAVVGFIKPEEVPRSPKRRPAVEGSALRGSAARGAPRRRDLYRQNLSRRDRSAGRSTVESVGGSGGISKRVE